MSVLIPSRPKPRALVILDGFTEPPTREEFAQHIASGGRGVLCASRSTKPIVGERVYLEAKYTFDAVRLAVTQNDTSLRWWWVDGDGKLCEGPRQRTARDMEYRVLEAREELARAERELDAYKRRDDGNNH